MSRAQRTRGPDGEGYALFDPETCRVGRDREIPHTIALAHRRFAIVDTTSAGRQPFWSDDEAVCLAFNGEVYNFVELRAELEKLGHQFHTRSDSEAFVKAYLAWGVGCFEHFSGFWAAAIYDSRRQQLLLSRDRLGKAPLYFARHGGALYFASEIAAIHAATGRNAFKVREQAVADFATHGWRDIGDETFFEGIKTFPAASFAWVQLDGSFVAKRYWSLPDRRLSERDISAPQAAGEFRRRLDDAVRIRLRADVPIGFELSGGLDSSCLVASAASQGFGLHAFTVSFPGTACDEEPFARQLAERYRSQVQYTVLKSPADDFWQIADDYVAQMAEPFHAPNVLTNRGVWRQMANRGIKVSLNGAAGDESWGGYSNDYFIPFLRQIAATGDVLTLLRSCRMFGDHPAGVREIGSRLRLAFSRWPQSAGVSSPGSRLYALPNDLNPLRVKTDAQRGPRADLCGLMRDLMGSGRMNYWLRAGNQSYMSVPTEVRCPFLDHRLVELAFSLPVTYLLRDGWTKWLVRKAMADRLPAAVVWRRRKMGFPFPYSKWAAQSKATFFTMIGRTECPYVDPKKLTGCYDALAKENPLYLWRMMSLCLWWKRCVLGESLALGGPARRAA